MELTPDQVNKFIADAVLNSQIGEVVKQSVARVVADLSKTYNNPFDEVIKQHVNRLIDAELATTYKPMLAEKIKAAMAAWATDESMEAIVRAATERLRSRY